MLKQTKNLQVFTLIKYPSLSTLSYITLLSWEFTTFLAIYFTLNLYLFCFQLWDVRDGQCKQTFTGHQTDINAIQVRNFSFIAFHEIKL